MPISFQIMGVIVVNTKAYKEGMGENLVELSRIMERIKEEYGVRMIVAVQPSDIRLINHFNIDVFSQHVDAIEYGSHTGWISPYAVKSAGAVGTLINHSEHRMKVEDIAKAVEISKKIRLETIICAGTSEISKAVACFSPDYVAVEPPELIGGDISVTKAQPEIVKKAVDSVHSINKNVKVLCGAGIKNGKDVSKAVELGAEGILVASGVVKVKEREKAIEDMAKAMVK